METRNKDGFGYSYVKDGKIINFKWALSFTELLKRDYPLLQHMPGNSWTIIHQRAASCGAISKENSHPFVVDNKWSICHNGSFREHRIVSLALSKFTNLKGQTDSEVAANLINFISPREFAMNTEIMQAGVYLCLNVNGTLEVIKNSGELSIYEKKNGNVLLSSELSILDYKQKEANRGWYKFNSDGTFNKFVERKWYVESFKHERWVHGGMDFHNRIGSVNSYSIANHHEYMGE